MTRSSTPLDQKFWKNFAEKTWEKKSIALKNIQSPLTGMDENQIFLLLVKFADRCRKLRNSEGFKFYVDGEKLYPDEVLDLLPEKKDQSLQGYHLRMNEIFEDYCLVCDELLQVNAEKQALLTQFTNELYRHVGFPNRFAEMGLYLGNYRKTPFGVHIDGCGVFSFPVVGTKKFRIWTPEFVKKNPALDRAFRYEKYKKHSQLLSAGPGDMTYWPSSAWHIAESDGSFNATWSLGVWIDRPFRESVVEILNELISQSLGSEAELGMTSISGLSHHSGQVDQLPRLYKQTLKTIRQISEKELKTCLTKAWMRHLSKQGFKTNPQKNISAKLDDQLQLQSPHSPILWQVSGSRLICSFAGVLVETPKSKALIKLFTHLNAGKKCSTKNVLGGTKSRDNLNCLRELAKAGAFIL